MAQNTSIVTAGEDTDDTVKHYKRRVEIDTGSDQVSFPISTNYPSTSAGKSQPVEDYDDQDRPPPAKKPKTSPHDTNFDENSVNYQLQRAKFPAEKWKSLANGLRLANAVSIIEADQRDSVGKLQALISRWVKSTTQTNQWITLVEAIVMCDEPAVARDIATSVSVDYSAQQETLPSTILTGPLISYASYLRELYLCMYHHKNSQFWEYLPRCEFIQLAMIGSEGLRRGDREEEMVRLAHLGKIETILDCKKSIDLNNLFPIPPNQPLVVLPPPPCPRVLLIEGAPGGGKSTLALHICHQWANCASFLAQFELVVLAYLREEAIQKATTLSDILPARTLEMSQMAASMIKASDGANVLFLFDGWDEFPCNLQKQSLISTIIRQPHKLSLHQSTVLITSRPVSSGNLLRIADRRVEILGFTRHEIREYIEKALKGNSTHIQKLVQHLKEHPVIEGYCYVPLHAAILVHVFLTLKGALPTTLHELFCSLVLCCIAREHARPEPDTSLPELSSLDDLPDDFKSKLRDLCILAYKGVMQDKVVFHQKDLCEFELPANPPSLGLLQAVQGLALNSKYLSYNFLHLSVQELLAAYHISHMKSNEHRDIFKKMFGGSRFRAVLHYYSGFTKLANEAVQTYITTSSQEKSKIEDLLPLLHCFYEAQEPSLCKLVKSQFENNIVLNNQWTPVDYLAIGYFLTSLLSTSSSDQPLQLTISDEFDNHKLKLLFLELSKMSTAVPSDRRMEIQFLGTTITIERANLIASLLEKLSFLSKLGMIMRQSKIDSGALRYIAEALQNDNSHLATLQIFAQANYICSKFDGLALKTMCEKNKSLTRLNLSKISGSSSCYIFQGLRHNTTLVHLTLKGPGLVATEDIAQALTTMLQDNNTLKYLNLSGNWNFSDSRACVFVGLQHNTSLAHLNLSNTGLVATEDIAQSLTTMLQDNNTLEHIDLSENHTFADAGALCVCQGLEQNKKLHHLNLSSTRITDIGAEHIAQALLKSKCPLRKLNISNNAITDEGFACIDKSRKASLELIK